MKYVETSRPSCSGETLFTVKYLPEQKPKAALCFHHGLGEHVGRYNQRTCYDMALVWPPMYHVNWGGVFALQSSPPWLREVLRCFPAT